MTLAAAGARGRGGCVGREADFCPPNSVRRLFLLASLSLSPLFFFFLACLLRDPRAGGRAVRVCAALPAPRQPIAAPRRSPAQPAAGLCGTAPPGTSWHLLPWRGRLGKLPAPCQRAGREGSAVCAFVWVGRPGGVSAEVIESCDVALLGETSLYL